MCDEHEQRRRDSDAAVVVAIAKLRKNAPRCDICGEPLTSWQQRRHLSCCAANGGRDPMCNPVVKIWYDDSDDGYRPCAACWRLGQFIGKRKRKRAAA
jgi:hypothetical protein